MSYRTETRACHISDYTVNQDFDIAAAIRSSEIYGFGRQRKASSYEICSAIAAGDGHRNQGGEFSEHFDRDGRQQRRIVGAWRGHMKLFLLACASLCAAQSI